MKGWHESRFYVNSSMGWGVDSVDDTFNMADVGGSSLSETIELCGVSRRTARMRVQQAIADGHIKVSSSGLPYPTLGEIEAIFAADRSRKV
jgi:hypothetical protein